MAEQRRWRPVVVLRAAQAGACGLLLSAAGLAQLPSTYRDIVDVRITEVEVVVTDRAGNPVFGLTPESFELYEDGERVEVTNFYAVESGRRRDLDASGEETEAVARLQERPYLVLMMDTSSVGAGDRNRVLARVRDTIDRLVDVTAGIMVVQVGSGLEVVSPFTSDRALLSGAIDRLEKSARLPPERMTHQFIQRSIESATPPPGEGGGAVTTGIAARDTSREEAGSLLGSIRAYANTQYHSQRTLNGRIQELISSLAGLRGRKAVLYVSNGFEERPGELLYRSWWDKYQLYASGLGVFSVESELNQVDTNDLVQSLVAHASANAVAFYPLEANGAGTAAFSAEVRSANTAALMREYGDLAEASLGYLAAGTGGLALINSSNVDHLIDNMSRGFESYYSLGFVSPRAGEGGRRKIEVKLRDRGLRARHARQYLEKSSKEVMQERVMAALYLDVAENPLQVAVELGEQKRHKNGNYLLPIIVKIPIANLTLLPQGNHHAGRLSLVVAAQDERGVSQPQRIELPINIPNPSLLNALSGSAGYAADMEVRPGEHKFAIAVRDELGGMDSTLNFAAVVGREGTGSR